VRINGSKKFRILFSLMQIVMKSQENGLLFSVSLTKKNIIGLSMF